MIRCFHVWKHQGEGKKKITGAIGWTPPSKTGNLSLADTPRFACWAERRKRARERKRDRESVCVCVCVWIESTKEKRERERDRKAGEKRGQWRKMQKQGAVRNVNGERVRWGERVCTHRGVVFGEALTEKLCAPTPLSPTSWSTHTQQTLIVHWNHH